MKNILLFKIYY